MKTSLSILNSDALNRYGEQFAVSALECAMWQRSLTGTPVHLGHDMHKPVAWMVPFGLYFQPGLVRLMGKMYFPESEKEAQDIYNARMNYIIELAEKEKDEYGEKLLSHIREFVSEDHKYLDAAAFSIVDKDIVQRVFPDLTVNLDKDGLIYLKDILNHFSYRGQGIFLHKIKPLCIFAHPYFRRSLSRHNNFHFIFLDELMSYSSEPEVNIRIKLDWDMIGYSPSALDAQELEYWYGPKYNDDISSIEPGLTRHEGNETDKLYYGISATEFNWKVNDGLHEFELEELKEEEAPVLPDTFACRYIHSIYNDVGKYFQHFDGAIRSYAGDLYLERIGKKMTEFGRRSQYEKLFRIDGKLSLEAWKSLATNYMQGNYLIYEYFGLERPETPQPIKYEPSNQVEQFVPFSINKNEGIRIAVSYHPPTVKSGDSHTVSICDMLSIGDEDHQMIEYDVVEVKKVLERKGKSLKFPAGVILGYSEDMYWNIPCIMHGSAIPEDDVMSTITAIREICEALLRREDDKVISMTLSWNMEDKEVRLSVLGHVVDLLDWLNQVGSVPVTHDDFVGWLEVQKEYLNKLKVNNGFMPMLEELAQFDGVLYIHRRLVTDPYKIKCFPDKVGLAYRLQIPETDAALAEAVEEGVLKPVIACIAKSIVCSKSKKEYIDSPYSKFLDDDVHTIVKDFDLIGCYWTDKPA